MQWEGYCSVAFLVFITLLVIVFSGLRFSVYSEMALLVSVQLLYKGQIYILTFFALKDA